MAQQVIAVLKNSFPDPIVMQLEAIEIFYPAEKYHQNYYNTNVYAGYCRVVIDPKIKKLRGQYAHKLKTEYAS